MAENVSVTSQKPADPTPPAEPTFEQALERLETIVQELEEGKIGLAEGLARYEEGVKLLRQCYQLLDGAQRRIELLNRLDPDGKEVCEPFDEGATSLEEKAHRRGRRRSQSPKPRVEPAEDEIDGPPSLF